MVLYRSHFHISKLSPHAIKCDRRVGGFTLIELIITIVVAAVLLAIALPNMSSILDRNQLIGAADAVYSQVQFARSEAIKSGRDIKLSYTNGTGWCSGMREDDGTTCNCSQTDPTNAAACAILGDGSTRVLKVVNGAQYSNIQMSGAPATMSFNRIRGTLNGAGGTVTITSSKSNRQVQVTVSALGSAHICSPAANHVGSYPAC